MGYSKLTVPNSVYPFYVNVFVTSADGNAAGTTLVCADLAQFPSLVGRSIRILSGNAQHCEREIAVHAAGGNTITVATAFEDNAGAAEQIVAGTYFCIKEMAVGGGGAAGPSPSIGLWMFGIADAGMAGSTTVITAANLAGFDDDLFNDDFYLEVIRNANNVGLAPEHEIQQITGYVGATGEFTTDAFSANVEENDQFAVIHHSLIGPELNLISTLIRNTFDLVNASLITTETGGTLTTDGTEQDLYINDAPANVQEPKIVKLNCTNMAAGDSIRIRLYERMKSGGGWVKFDDFSFSDAQDPAGRYIGLKPNRFGYRVTIEETAGAHRAYDWEAFARV